MRRGSLFFIALLSAIITFISLNIPFGRPGYYYERYPYFHRYHHTTTGIMMKDMNTIINQKMIQSTVIINYK